MGLQVIPKEAEASDTVTAVEVPKGAEDKIRHMMQDEFNLLIGGSLPGWGEGKTIRIAHMGLTASLEYIVPTLFSLERVLSKLGFEVKAGSGVSAAMQVFTGHPQEWIRGLLARYRERILVPRLRYKFHYMSNSWYKFHKSNDRRDPVKLLSSLRIRHTKWQATRCQRSPAENTLTISRIRVEARR